MVSTPGAGRGTLLIYLAVFGAYTGQQILTPILPPLARELSLSEFQYGMVMSVSAAVVALVSPLWGRRADVWGRKRLLLGGLFGAAAGLAAFALCVRLGLTGAVSALVVFTLLMVTRGLLFGGSLAAVPVAAQAYVADVTAEGGERVKGIARVGAALGLALVLGPGLGGLLGDLGAMPALLSAPVLIALVAVAVWIWLPAEQSRGTARRTAARLSPLDARIWPHLVAGVGIYLSTSVLQTSIGFLLQDRLELTSQRTVELAGMTLLAGGLPMLLVQGLLIPRLRWQPLRLMRVGVPLTAVAFAVICVADSLPVFLAAVVLSGTGHSLAIPGYNSALSLSVGPSEQGGVAGLAASANAVTTVLGPLAATALYQAGAALPFLAGALELGALLLFLLMHRAHRTAPVTGPALPLAAAESAPPPVD
ncbi:MFS transporter [Streptomyces sp. TS71-3]|uniref:MFS transporter n=1 Tax=Streptomyces sp. TS71-3 TaxID=2733862 RepID=UPI001B11DD64|nr:MFS transporter [Streptomyces sp. TS71-3]GHJ42332.1 MFS transporter [Streptomyces sp. TS71-3]